MPTRCKKVREFTTSPVPPPYTHNVAYLRLGVLGRVHVVINHAKFELDRFRGFGAPGCRKSLSPIDWRYRPYNSVRTNVLHCDDDCEQQPGIALPTSLATTQMAGVSYPTPRAVSAPQQQQQSAAAQKQHRAFTGVVTKLHDNFGFIDDDVFFQMR